jgi:RluA family pseudouridine synthase
VSTAVKLSSPATKEFWEIPVLFEDGDLLALDKPAGLMPSPDPLTPERPNLMTLLHDAIAAGKPWAAERNLTYLNQAHRLDTETSGVLLLAKNKPAFIALADQFGAEKPVRNHITLVQGVPEHERFEVDEKIGVHPLKPGEMRIDPRGGKKAKTEFTLLEAFSRWSLVRCTPLTERPQQIRLHLSHAGLPVVGDGAHHGKPLWLSRLKRDFHLKPGREERALIPQPMVHLEDLSFTHPVTNEAVTVKSEWPKALRVALKYLRQYAVT